MKKLIKTLLIGMVLLFAVSGCATVRTAPNAFEQPKITNLGVNVTYKNEIYTIAQHEIVSIPFKTKDFSLVSLGHYYMIVDNKILKGVMVVSILNGPEFGYAVYDIEKEEGFGLMDTDCDGIVDIKVPYDSDILIPDCLFEHKTHETN